MTETLAASSPVRTIGWYSGFVGVSVTPVWPQLSPSVGSLTDEYLSTVNLGGRVKSGHLWTPQIRPFPASRDGT